MECHSHPTWLHIFKCLLSSLSWGMIWVGVRLAMSHHLVFLLKLPPFHVFSSKAFDLWLLALPLSLCHLRYLYCVRCISLTSSSCCSFSSNSTDLLHMYNLWEFSVFLFITYPKKPTLLMWFYSILVISQKKHWYMKNTFLVSCCDTISDFQMIHQTKRGGERARERRRKRNGNFYNSNKVKQRASLGLMLEKESLYKQLCRNTNER